MHFKLKRQGRPALHRHLFTWKWTTSLLHSTRELQRRTDDSEFAEHKFLFTQQPPKWRIFSGSLRISRRWYHRLLLADIREPKPVIYTGVIHAEIRQRLIHSECCCSVFCFFLFGRGRRTSGKVLRWGPGHVCIRWSPVWAIGSENASSLRLEGGLTAVLRHLWSDCSGRTSSEQTEVKTRGHGRWESYELPPALRSPLTPPPEQWDTVESHAIINLVKPQPAAVIYDIPLCAIKRRRRRVSSLIPEQHNTAKATMGFSEKTFPWNWQHSPTGTQKCIKKKQKKTQGPKITHPLRKKKTQIRTRVAEWPTVA